MEKLDSVIVMLVLKVKEIVLILMISVKMVLFVAQTIAQLPLALTLKLIVVINQLLEMKIFVHLENHVMKMKEIAILMMSVIMVLLVAQTIAQLHLALSLTLIAVINQLLEMNIFVHLEFVVEKMKEIVICLTSVKMVLIVDQTIAQPHLVLMLKLIVVISQLLEMKIFAQQ